MSSSAPSASPLRKLFSELEQLFQTETEARVSTSVQAAERALAEHLNQSVRRLRQATGFADLASTLCDGSAPFARGCVVFRADGGTVRGEKARGATREMGEITFAASGAGAFANASESREPVVALASAAEVTAALVELFDSSAGEKVYLFPLVAEQGVAGFLYAAGVRESAALELLTQAAGAVWEGFEQAAIVPGVKPASGLVTIDPAPAPAPAGSQPVPDWDAMPPVERGVHVKAQRFARVQVAEMRLYHAEAVKTGRTQRNLYQALQESIDRARVSYRETFTKGTPGMVDYLHHELVHTLANEDPSLLGEKYPGPLV